jgi:uncharacterized protein YyaL (SSP411 family)
METHSDREMGLREIVLVENAEAGDAAAMLAPLRTSFAPDRVVIRALEGPPLESLEKRLSIVARKRSIAGKTTAYVCEDRVCQFPTNDPEVFRKRIEALPERRSAKADRR